MEAFCKQVQNQYKRWLQRAKYLCNAIATNIFYIQYEPQGMGVSFTDMFEKGHDIQILLEYWIIC